MGDMRVVSCWKRRKRLVRSRSLLVLKGWFGFFWKMQYNTSCETWFLLFKTKKKALLATPCLLSSPSLWIFISCHLEISPLFPREIDSFRRSGKKPKMRSGRNSPRRFEPWSGVRQCPPAVLVTPPRALAPPPVLVRAQPWRRPPVLWRVALDAWEMAWRYDLQWRSVSFFWAERLVLVFERAWIIEGFLMPCRCLQSLSGSQKMSFQISDDKIAMLIIKRNLPFEIGEPQQTSEFPEKFCFKKHAFPTVCSSNFCRAFPWALRFKHLPPKPGRILLVAYPGGCGWQILMLGDGQC